MRIWSDCACLLSAVERGERLSRESGEHQARVRGATISDLSAIARLTFVTFDGARYAHDPVPVAREWLAAALSAPAGSYHAGTPPLLYLYSAGKGRGKTHLAAALAHEARAGGRGVFFADEIAFVNRLWAADLESRAGMVQHVGERAHVAVLDDLGQRERAGDTLRDAWYSVVNPRWLGCRWTVATSNYTPDELLDRGTINEATYSRLLQMCGREIVTLESGDYRLGAR